MPAMTDLRDSLLLRACRREPVPRPPVWLMRQAGRYMREYRERRAGIGFLELCKSPARAAEVALEARDYLQVDAAIVFSDILVLLEALGLPLRYASGDGPRLDQPIAAPQDVAALRPAAAAVADLGYVTEALRLTVAGLPAGLPCIGFCGAPFTLAAYAIEGGGSRHFTAVKSFMHRESAAWHALMELLAASGAALLNAQIAAGAACVQVFDSWVGCLTREDFIECVQPHLRRLIAAVTPGVPVILFGTGTGHLLDLLADCGPSVLGLDHQTPLREGWERCGGPGRIAVQGNLDPGLLLAPQAVWERRARAILAATRPGHIFNLGHGVLKETDPRAVRELVALVRGSAG